MGEPGKTVWTMIRAAARGDRPNRDEFVRCYQPLVGSYLAERWRGSPLAREIEDIAQEIFLDCFRGDGVLDRVEEGRPGGFRAFFFGVIRNHARRVESAANARGAAHLPDPDLLQSREESLSRAFDRDWARGIMAEAAKLQAKTARQTGSDAERRVDLLRLRFHDGLRIRVIAERWKMDPARVHREYAKARKEYREALMKVVAFHHPGTPADTERECLRLLTLLE